MVEVLRRCLRPLRYVWRGVPHHHGPLCLLRGGGDSADERAGVFIAHCPESNTNLSSGIAPVRRYLDEQIPVGLGSDVAGGTTENLFAAMRHAIQASKLRWRLSDQSLQPLNMEEVFYLASKGGGAFFGKVGSFEPGYEFDAVILDDARLEHPQTLTVKQRLERVIYLGDEREVAGKYVAGRKVL